MKGIILATTLGLCATGEAFSSPDDMIAFHAKKAQGMNATAPVGVSSSRGSLVYLDNGSNCDKSITSGFGFTLGSCVVRINEGHGVYYSDCYSTASQIKFTFTECSDVLCKEDCKTYQMAEDKCSSDPEPYNGQVECASNVDAYENYDELKLHSKEYFGGDEDCSGQYGYWSSQSMSCTSAYNRACGRGNNYYYFETVCEM